MDTQCIFVDKPLVKSSNQISIARSCCCIIYTPAYRRLFLSKMCVHMYTIHMMRCARQDSGVVLRLELNSKIGLGFG